MSQDKLLEIVDFAIAEERKAYELYEKTAKKAGENNPVTPLLLQMAKMERGHEAKLNSFKNGVVPSLGTKEVEDLKIGDYLVDVEITEESSIQDVMIFSIKSEMKAYELYTNLSKLYEKPEEKALFENLAAEESGHKNDLEKAYDDYAYKEN